MKKTKQIVTLGLLMLVVFLMVGCGSSLKGQKFYYVENGTKSQTRYLEFTSNKALIYDNGEVSDYAEYELLDEKTILLKGSMRSVECEYDKSGGVVYSPYGTFKK